MARVGAVVSDIAVAQPALYGVLSSAATVVDDVSPYWVNGFQYETLECSTAVKLAPVCTDGDAVQVIDPSSDGLFNTYFPFSIQTSFKCSTMSRKPDELEALAVKALDLCRQKAIEHELWTGELAKAEAVDYAGEDEYPNRFLASSAAVDVTPTPGTPVKSKHGLALLEGALADCGCGIQGTIHVTREVASALSPKNEDNRLITPLGNNVIAGAGYTGSGPDGTEPGGTQVWMYATGPVTVRLGPIEATPDKINQSVNIANNTSEYFVEQAAAVTWGSCCHYAVLVDLSLDYA